MKNIRAFTLRGRLWADPEQVSSTIVKIPVVVNERYRDGNGEWKEKSEWFKPVAFGRQAELALAYLRKGPLVEIHGELQNRSYDKDGQKHYTMDLVVSEFIPLVEMKLSKGTGDEEEGESRPSNRRPEQDEPAPRVPERPVRVIDGGRRGASSSGEPPLGMVF